MIPATKPALPIAASLNPEEPISAENEKAYRIGQAAAVVSCCVSSS